MTGILTALGSGVTARKILEFLMRKSPELAPRIQNALAAGLSADKILSFFKNEKNFDRLRTEIHQEYPMENNANPLVQAENIRSKNMANDPASQLQRAVPPILGTAAALGTSYALGRAIPPILQQTGIVNPSKIAQQSQIQASQTAQQPPQVSKVPLTQNEPNVTQPTQSIQPQGIINPKEYLENLGIREKVDNLLKAGNTPEQAAAALGIKRSGEAKIDPELLKNIEEYAKQAQVEENKPEIAEIPQNQEKKSPETINSVEKALIEGNIQQVMRNHNLNEDQAKKFIESHKKYREESEKGKSTISKNDTVASPQGIGEVKEIRNGQALIDVDGKLQKVDESELEAEPEEIKSLDYEKMALDYVNSIPESERSTAMLFNFFTPTSKNEETGEELGRFHVIFPTDPMHIGIYENVPKSMSDEINAGKTAPKTTNKTILGEHTEGVPESRYAAATDLRKYPEKYPYKKEPIPYNLAHRLFMALKSLEDKRLAEIRRLKNEEKARAKKKKV